MYRRQPDKGNCVKRDILVTGYSSFFGLRAMGAL